ncbi:LacI family DNA-binding transcriptional regulator [Methylobacillus gramineus]|uniref:LacI family DNA-binding transcriptional regulator n=1 Tax=Methylobacillus gramineus TaxID=755169 RepID=UPI001CFF5E82|nr:LacI family DNA-binding transcriptional regulator [Methylobacillus gramineus]MCB5186102.1 LacI family DNA-binding transcriptional regulator [Methylobacillus gramineus]
MSGKRKGLGRATVHDVAKLAGVSSITVSRYFKQPDIVSPVLRERISEAVRVLDYLPNHAAGGLASTRGRIVAMVIPNISGPIFANTIQSFSDELSRYGYQLLLASSYFSIEQEERAVRAFLGWSPAALVLTSQYHSEETERLVAKATMPIVETWDYEPARKPLQVGFSHGEVGRQAVEYLHGKGYQRIAFVQNSMVGDLSALDRRDGYIAAMASYGLNPWVFVPTQADPFEAGKQAVNSLLLRKEPAEAIIFANDNLAAGGMLAGQRAGMQFPRDCAIFGFGNYAFSEMLLPSLTTIRPPAKEIGEVAAMRILQALGEIPTDEPVQHLNLLECELIVRESA